MSSDPDNRRTDDFSSTLNNDTILMLYNLLDFETYLRARLTCKRWYDMSYDRSVLFRYYAASYLDRAHGPAFWHTPEKLAGLLIRSHQLQANLASDNPVIHSYRAYPLPDDTISSKICSQLLFLSHGPRGKFLKCEYLGGTELRTVWNQELSNSDGSWGDWRIRSCNSHDTAQELCSIVSLLVTDLITMIVFKFDVRLGGETIEVAQRDKFEYELAPGYWGQWGDLLDIDLHIQGDWIQTSRNTNVFLVHYPSSKTYCLSRGQPQNKHRVTVFAGERFLASLMKSSGKGAIAIYEIPDPNSDSPMIQDWVHLIPLEVFGSMDVCHLHFLQGRTWSHPQEPSKRFTVLQSIICEIVGNYGGENPSFLASSSFLDITLQPDSSASPYAISSLPRSDPYWNFMIGKHGLRQYWILKAKYSSYPACVRNASISHLPLTIGEDGSFGYGKSGVLKMPEEVVLIVHKSKVDFDELLGRFYAFDTKSQLHVVSYI